MATSEAQLRNIGIVAHINAGKTTLTERILFDTGKQRFLGEVDMGTATMDFMEEEQRRGISISAAVTRVVWRDCHFNLIDTPGHVDFTAEVERSLRVIDGAVVVLDGVRAVETQTEMVWRQADRRSIPRIVFVNKMDRPASDFDACIKSLRERLGCEPVPVVIPLKDGDELVGLVDLPSSTVHALKEGVELDFPQQARQELVEICADFDEGILRDFLNDSDVDSDRIHAALRRGTLSNKIVPVVAGSALGNQGVDLLLEAARQCLPSPLDLPPVQDIEDGDSSRHPSRDDSFCGLVFKTQQDGDDRLSFVRVYSGTLVPGQLVECTGREEAFTPARIWLMHALHREAVDLAQPGDVVAIPKVSGVHTGDTLHASGRPIHLEPVRFPLPVLTMALEPLTDADAASIYQAACGLVVGDPTLRLDKDDDTEDLLVSGMGELHLEVFGSRLIRRVGERVRLTRPRVAMLETILRPGSAMAECRQQVPQASWCSAKVGLALEPAPGLGKAWFIDDTGGGPDDVRQALLEAFRDRARTGLSNSCPATDMKMRLRGVEVEGTGSSVILLALEALDVACRKALDQADPILLEPRMVGSIECPPEYLSGVLADLRARGMQINSVIAGEGIVTVSGKVPLSAVLGWTTKLRSLTRGLGSMELSPDGFQPVSGQP